jgi:glycosyltransferase involved in cell wall biosynthesis
MLPKVSVITLTFNHEKYMDECIQSVLNQTMKEWEMIIIDDGSADRTPTIIQQYDDPRIIYIRKEHRGINFLGENYNEALRISKGEFILILEGDDYIPPNRIEVQLPTLKDNQIVLSHGRYAYAFKDKIVVYPTVFKTDVLTNQPIGLALKGFLQGFNPIGTQSVMIRKSTLLEIGGFTQPNCLPLVDYPTWMELALRGRFAFVPEVLGYWRRHPLSITMNRNDSIFYGFINYCDEFVASHGERLRELGLEKFIQKRGALAYLSLAWIRLSKKDWKYALELSKKGWSCQNVPSWSFKMKIIAAIASSYLRVDIPSFLKQIRQWLYQQEL